MCIAPVPVDLRPLKAVVAPALRKVAREERGRTRERVPEGPARFLLVRVALPGGWRRKERGKGTSHVEGVVSRALKRGAMVVPNVERVDQRTSVVLCCEGVEEPNAVVVVGKFVFVEGDLVVEHLLVKLREFMVALRETRVIGGGFPFCARVVLPCDLGLRLWGIGMEYG